MLVVALCGRNGAGCFARSAVACLPCDLPPVCALLVTDVADEGAGMAFAMPESAHYNIIIGCLLCDMLTCRNYTKLSQAT